MARVTIKSRVLNETLTFWCPDGGGYVRLEHPTDPNRAGSAGRQICRGGGFQGPTISTVHSGDLGAVEQSLRDEARKWVRARIRAMRDTGWID